MAQTISRIGILLAALLVLGISPLGFFHMSDLGGAITTLHIPVILAATLEGPLAAAFLGAMFGLIAGIEYPLAGVALGFHVFARLLAGLAAAITFQILNTSSRQGKRITIASAGAALVGTLANTLIMTLLILLLTGASPEELLSIAIIHGIVELLAAEVIVVPLTIALVGGQH